jgi:SPP1 gp7 family putative phage head morphogenesis protein
VIIEAADDFEEVAGEMRIAAGIDPGAGERIQAAVSPGSPLSRLLADANAAGAEAARQALFTGVILGDNPRVVAARLRAALAIAKNRAMTIARTEVLRAYRGSIRERMRHAPGVVGWVWVSARDRRTCPMCWAMHGTKHRLDEEFATHPNCRCSQAPLSARDISPLATGSEDFERLAAATQRRILGPGKYDLYSRGAIDLPDLVGEALDPVWGRIRYERPLYSLRG